MVGPEPRKMEHIIHINPKIERVPNHLKALVESVSLASSDEQPILDADTVLGPGAHVAIAMEQIQNLPKTFSQTEEALEVVDCVGNARITVWLLQLGTTTTIEVLSQTKTPGHQLNQRMRMCSCHGQKKVNSICG